ncbi:hypothetical protein ACIQOU_08485 [Streptomyces sp. NPDC091279]|uniref:hypothetical protein n=1 Tax=Streptomyces sp. NPDC091279 TaxID=3365983 RepID=UPI0038059892
MTVGLVSTIISVFYAGTVSLLALTATFARGQTRRRDARRTLVILIPGGGGTGVLEGAEGSGDPGGPSPVSPVVRVIPVAPPR